MIKIGLTDFTPADKIIEIRDKNQIIKAKYAISATDILKHTLMSEHYIEISFLYNRNIAFKRSDYILWNGEKFTLREDYTPEQVNKYKYQYTLKFEATEMLFQDIQFYYLNQNLKESEWRLAGNAEYFIKIAVDNVNRYFGVTDFKVGVIEPAEIKDIIFDTNTNTFDALIQIAESYEAEWYMTGKTINLVKKVSFGAEVDFETEVSVLSMSRSEGENSTKYTRILALGSTRNIPKDYRGSTPGESVDAVYPKRLRIPVSKGDVIDAFPNMSPDEVVEGTVIFDEVYPKRVGTVGAVGTIEYTDTDEDTGEVTKWNAFKIKDPGINFKEEYVLPGEELRLIFQSGDLNGFDFALRFHKDGFSKTDNSQYFEIVRSEDYGKKMPNDTMKPKAGDKYVLYGFNIALVSDQFVPAGEQELFDTASAWLQKQLHDTSVYDCPTVIDYFKKNEMDLEIGQKVKLILDHIDISVRLSRIMGYEKKLYNKYDATYTVGDNSAYNRLTAIEKDIKELQYAGVIYESTGSGGVYLIKQFDTTTPSDHNAYSAKASDAKYFNKQTGGAVQGDTLFQKNIQVQGSAISDVFQNSTFTAGQLGSGFQIKRDANGQSYMEIDNLMVRRETVFNRLTIAEIKSVGGTILLSLANMVISKVEDKTSAWRCYFDNANGTIPNDFAVSDQVICRKYTGKNIKYYWSKVTSVGVDFIEISKTDKDGSGVPAIADEVIQLGNRNDVNRQYAIMLSAYGSDAPSIKQYAGINSYDMTGKEVTTISPKGNKFTGSFTVSTNGTTAPVYKERQVFTNGTVYYLNDRVSYLGSYWVCIVESTITTPSETSLAWRKDTAGQTDINNAVDSIQIGVRNLLRDTSFDKLDASHWKSRHPFSHIISIDDSQQLNGCKSIKISATQIPTSISDDVLAVPTVELVKNGDYILSFWAKGNTSLNIRTGFAGYSDTLVLSDTWKYYQVKMNTTMSESSSKHLLLSLTSAGICWINNIILVEGNKSAKWQPAPEDAIDRANEAQKEAEKVRTEYKADFVILDTKIASKVSQTDFNALGNRVSQTESQITQQAGKIESVVVKVDNMSIGSDNLMTNSDFVDSISPWKADGSHTIFSDNTEKHESTNSLKCISTGETTTGGSSNRFFTTSITSGEITMSFYAKADKPIKLYGRIGHYNSANESNIMSFDIGTDWKLYTTKTINVQSSAIVFWLASAGTLWFAKPMVVNGNTVPTWSKSSIDIELIANLAQTSANNAQSKADEAKQDATNAQSAANKAQSDANKANNYILDVASDNKLTPSEKKEIQREWHGVLAEYPKNVSEASNYGVSSTTYTSSYNTLSSYITPLLSDLNTTSDIVGGTMRQYFKNYYDARSVLLNAISSKAKQLADAAQSSANNAQNTADSKNRSYYQDAVPAAPSGGHKVGDLWYKTSLVDSSGNINADTSKNIYQLQYRWDGTIWKQVNWSVTKSKIEQTDSSINLLVEKTGINGVGTGSSLYSLINQTASEIRLEVNKLQIGGRNYLRNSSFQTNTNPWMHNGSHMISVDKSNTYNDINSLKCIATETGDPNGSSNRFFTQPQKQGRHIFSFFAKADRELILKVRIGNNLVGTFSITTEWKYFATTSVNAGESIVCWMDRAGVLWMNSPQFEEGDKATSWSPAPEDVQTGIDKAQNTADSKTTLDEVSSSLTLTDNKISLASKTIELKGTTIAKAIEAEDLKVGSRDKGACLEVSVDKSDSQKGYFYVKGSSGTNSSLVIDSGNQSIEITSPYSSTGNPSGGTPGSSSGKSTVSITSQSGGVRVSNDNYDTSIVSTSGIFANNAGQGMYPASAANYSKAAIVGLGNGSVASGISGDSFVAGVYGRASNSSTGEAYGGYFDMLRANGVVLGLRTISDKSTTNTRLYTTDSLIVGTASVQQNIYLPNNPYNGTVIWLKQWWTGFLRIYPGTGQKLYDDSSENSYIDIGEGWTAMCVFIGNWGINGGTTHPTWVLSKFKF